MTGAPCAISRFSAPRFPVGAGSEFRRNAGMGATIPNLLVQR